MKKQTLPLIIFLLLLLISTIGNTQDFKFELFVDKYLDNFDEVDPVPFGANGVVATDNFYISVINENSQNITKQWRQIKFQNTKWAQDASFKEKQVWTKNEDIFVAIISESSKTKECQLLKCQFDKILNLTNEVIVTKFPLTYVDQPSNKIEKSECDLIKMKNTDYYLFSRVSYIEKIGYKMEYSILDLDFNIKTNGILNLPDIIKRETEDTYTAMKRVIHSSKILEEGDLVINVNDQLFLVNQNNIMKLDLVLERTLNSYQLIQDESKQIILVGSYVEGTEENKKSGIALIKLNNEDLGIASQDYLLINDDFNLNVDELNRKFSGSKYNTSSNIAQPFVFKAEIFPSDEIKIAIIGLTKGYNDYGKFIGTENINILTINSKNEILQEIVIPKTNTSFEDNQVIFGEKQTLILSSDYTHNYNTNSDYKPSYETIQLQQLRKVFCTILLENESGKFTDKKIEVKSMRDVEIPSKIRAYTINYPEERILISALFLKGRSSQFGWINVE